MTARHVRDRDGIVHIEIQLGVPIDPTVEIVNIVTGKASFIIDKHCMRDFSMLDAEFTNADVTCIACITR